MERKRVYKRKRTIRTEFGMWFTQNMFENGLTQMDVAKKLHITRPSVCNHAAGLAKPTFMNVVSYCWVFGSKDDPEEIYKLTDRFIDPIVTQTCHYMKGVEIFHENQN